MTDSGRHSENQNADWSDGLPSQFEIWEGKAGQEAIPVTLMQRICLHCVSPKVLGKDELKEMDVSVLWRISQADQNSGCGMGVLAVFSS